YARSAYTDEEFRNKLMQHLTCRCPDGAGAGSGGFLSRCSYFQGSYEMGPAYQKLAQTLLWLEGPEGAQRLFYMAVPPGVFLDVARAIGQVGLARPSSAAHWTRVVVEKPFGSDRESSDRLVRDLEVVFTEDQTYRIDHYLGKELIHNLLVLRFANLIFEPIWNRLYIDHVQITWKEDLGIGNRGGYYDDYGIIRDVMQNHLLQIMALVAMEPPSRLDATAIRGKTIELLRNVEPVKPDELVLGQYAGTDTPKGRLPGYREEPRIPAHSRTPTYAAAVLRVPNWRWDGVPFFMRAGKALETKVCEVRIRFKDTPINIFKQYEKSRVPNELVIRIQPDEAIYFKIVNKIPGLKLALDQCMLDLRYAAAFGDKTIPDAYECLLLEVLEGDKTMFVGALELEALWDVFTPALHEIDAKGVCPEPYAIHSRGPAAADPLILRHGRQWTE
ncbi:MAG: glucose-6-phosphate dehydrogenase, partial [Lentisphaerae bacterium]|nr:glucose-6-phosphate dehydrogenase [Lentisphaerota bacterium]